MIPTPLARVLLFTLAFALMPLRALAADTFVEPPASGSSAYWKLASGKLVPVQACFTSDGSGAIVPLGGSAAALAVVGFGAATTAQRTAAVIGNATGALDAGVGAAGAQTLRVALSDADKAFLDGVESGLATLATSAFFTRSDSYTTAANGTTVDASAKPPKYFSVQVKGVGGAGTVWDIRLECSLNGTDFSQVIQHTNTDTDGFVKSLTTPFPCLYFRSRASGAVTLGGASALVATIIGSQ